MTPKKRAGSALHSLRHQPTPKPIALKPSEDDIFRTPDEVAAEDVTAAPFVPIPIVTAEPPAAVRFAWLAKLREQWPPTRKQWLIAGLLALLVIGSLVFLLLPTAKPVAHIVKHSKASVKVVPPTTVASTLSGLPVNPLINARPVTGVMIENSLDARPQSGLSQASVVFEAIAEGGITRFLALFQDTQPDNIGPIRSARPYYEQWALGFDAGYAHVGGSPEAIDDIHSWGVKDLDQFYNGNSYHRIDSRAAPHNVYTGVPTLVDLQNAKGYTTSKFTGFLRKTKPTKPQTPTAKSIDLAISGPLFNVHYDYDAVSNSYKRSEAGAPHIDADTNTQLSPKVVIALVLPYSLESDGYHSSYNTLGSGPAFVFQDGIVTTGVWNKADNASQFTFTDSGGAPLPLNAGQTWLSAIDGSDKVSYAP